MESNGAGSCFFQPCYDGNVMMTASTGPLVVVPIFWNPTGYPMTSAYKNIITSYLGDVAKKSGQTQNVFSVLNEYSGNNGQIHYNVQLGPVINDTDPLRPAAARWHPMTRQGFTSTAPATARAWMIPSSRPKSRTSSRPTASRTTSPTSTWCTCPSTSRPASCPERRPRCADGQFCTINHQPTAAYCAYHSADPTAAVYANLSYPIYQSPVGFTCGSDARFPVVESPNGNPDADTEISPTSHEISEAITDPDTETGWYDSSRLRDRRRVRLHLRPDARPEGGYFNQVINGLHFLTQEEFSNNLFASSGGTAGCLQSG